MTIPKRFLGAFKCGHRKSQQKYIDDELSQQLLDIVMENSIKDEYGNITYLPSKELDALDYITKFNNEYHKGVISTDGSALHTNELSNLTGKYGQPITLKKACQDLHNARNRDISTREELFLEPLLPKKEYN